MALVIGSWFDGGDANDRTPGALCRLDVTGSPSFIEKVLDSLHVVTRYSRE